MFEGFRLEWIVLSQATLRVRIGGSGPPILLLHGHPRTHTTWHRVAPLLADTHTVVCPDLRGFGKSSKPADQTGHAGSSKRAKARDCLELMSHLGFDRFAVGGHDRGCYTAFRTAMDFPDAVSRFIGMDAVPILDALERCDEQFARRWWHWFYFAQPDIPERAISADPVGWYGGRAETMGDGNFADYLEAIGDPATVHGMIEDYRAGLGIDRAHDLADREAGRRLACPALILWSAQDDLAQLYGDPLEVWASWAPKLGGHAIDCGHHMAEEAPEALAAAILQFLHAAP